MSIYVRDAAGNRQKFAGVGLPGPPGADGKSAYQYAVDGGFTGTEAEFAALMGVHSNPNLLDNWYFADPINQRGQNEYTGVGYGVDRWRKFSAGNGIIIQDGFIVLTAGTTLSQPLEGNILKSLDGNIVTASILTANGLLYTGTGIYTKGNFLVFENRGTPIHAQLYISASGIFQFYDTSMNLNLLAAKLELGPVQTLAHQDADGNWVLNDPPPDKTLELLKCQSYQMVGPLIACPQTMVTTSKPAAFLSTPVTLAKTPTIVGDFEVRTLAANEVVPTASVSAINLRNNGVEFIIGGVSQPCFIYFLPGTTLDANP